MYITWSYIISYKLADLYAPNRTSPVFSASVSLSDVNFPPNLENVSWLQIVSELPLGDEILTHLFVLLFATFNHLVHDETA